MNLHQIGQILKEEREKQQISLQEIAEHTQIRCAQLEALEQGDESKLPARVYVKGFIKAYGKFIQFNTQKILDVLGPDDQDQDLNIIQPVNIRDSFGQNFSLIHIILSIVIVFFIGLIIFIRSALEEYESRQSTIHSSFNEDLNKSISDLKLSTDFSSTKNPLWEDISKLLNMSGKTQMEKKMNRPGAVHTDDAQKNQAAEKKVYKDVKNHPLYLKTIEKRLKRNIPVLRKLKKSKQDTVRSLQSIKKENSLASVNENKVIGDESIEIEEKILEKIERENKSK